MSSSGSSRPTMRRVVEGVPRRCWCGEKITTYVSKTEENPYRRFYRCEIAMQLHNLKKSEDHLFKWVDEAMLEEIKKVDAKHNKLVEDVKELKKSINDSFLATNAMLRTIEEEMKAKLEDKVKYEEAMKVGLGVFVVGVIALLFKKLVS